MNIKTLARKIRVNHRKSRSWPKTGWDFGISGGMAYKIAMNEYEPANEITRANLGLDVKTCSKCGHRHFNRIKKDKPDFIVQWHHIPTDERHRVIKQYLEWRNKNEHT